MPNRNGWVKPNMFACATSSKFMSPKAYATTQPMTRPSSTAMVARNPLKIRWIATMTAMVPRA